MREASTQNRDIWGIISREISLHLLLQQMHGYVGERNSNIQKQKIKLNKVRIQPRERHKQKPLFFFFFLNTLEAISYIIIFCFQKQKKNVLCICHKQFSIAQSSISSTVGKLPAQYTFWLSPRFTKKNGIYIQLSHCKRKWNWIVNL